MVVSALAVAPKGLLTSCIEIEATAAVDCMSSSNGKWKRSSSNSNSTSSNIKGSNCGGLNLCSSMLDTWRDSRDASRVLWQTVPNASSCEQHGPRVVNEFGGQYEENYEDVDKHLLDYFTQKAVRTLLVQLYEMNPGKYVWLYNFVVKNKPQDSKLFIRVLVKENQELGERVMVTRLHLFNKWAKKYKHASLQKAISEQNLELLRERLTQTVRLPSDGEDLSQI